jgi:FkbM family methyltransferase
LKTTHKFALVRSAYRAIKLARGLFGLGTRCQVMRDGLRYDLDLSQAIDLTIFVLGRFEPSTVAAFRRYVKPGATVLDIGANIGAQTLQLARLVGPNGRVLSFEPTDFAFAKLRRNLELNPQIAGQVTALQYFLTAGDRNALPHSVYSSWALPRSADAHEKHLGLRMATAGARGAALDRVLAEQGVERVDLVKLDVDGFECDVLAGASDMIRRDRPTFVMEIMPYGLVEQGASLEQFLSFFLPFGYRLYDERTEAALPTDAKALEPMVGEGASINVIARAT